MFRAGALLAVAAGLLALMPAPPAAAQGCSMCRTYTEGADDGLVRGINRSAMFMVSVPILLVTGVGGWLFVRLREDEALDGDEDGPRTPTIPIRRDES